MVAPLSSAKDDGQENLERLPRGPKGDQGAQGERGERGLPWRVVRAIVTLFVIPVILAGFAIFWVDHAVTTEQGKWCGLVVTLDQADAAAAIKPASGTFTAALVGEIHQLRQSLGCGEPP